MTRQELFNYVLEHAESFGEYPEDVEGTSKSQYLNVLSKDEVAQLDDAITKHAEQAFERHLDNFYGGSEPVTLEEMQRKSLDEKRKLR